MKMSSTTFKGANNSLAAQLPDGEQLYFDKFALSMTLPGFRGLLTNIEFHKFLQNCNSLFQAQIEGKPLLLTGDRNQTVGSEDDDDDDEDPAKNRNKKARVLESDDEDDGNVDSSQKQDNSGQHLKKKKTE